MTGDNQPAYSVLRDSALNEEFLKHGFVKVPLLNPGTVHRLNETFSKMDSGVDKAFYTSIWSQNENYRTVVDREIKGSILPFLGPVLTDYRPVFANFMVKKPLADSQIGLHQDWTFVDELRHVAVNVWCPLTDSNIDNGTLQVVPGSHKLNSQVRARNMMCPYDNIRDLIYSEFLTPIEASAGEAVIFDERLLHASSDNLSDQIRLAASVVMIPQSSELVHYILDPQTRNKVYKLKVEPDYFTKYGLEENPIDELSLVDAFPYELRYVDKNEFEALLNDNTTKERFK